MKGLSTLCERLLGKKLDKTEQCSVWDRRPLRANQVNPFHTLEIFFHHDSVFAHSRISACRLPLVYSSFSVLKRYQLVLVTIRCAGRLLYDNAVRQVRRMGGPP